MSSVKRVLLLLFIILKTHAVWATSKALDHYIASIERQKTTAALTPLPDFPDKTLWVYQNQNKPNPFHDPLDAQTMPDPIGNHFTHAPVDLLKEPIAQSASRLQSTLIEIKYAVATELANLLKAEKNTFLSTEGHVSVDRRTNTLLLQDIPEKIKEIRQLIARLDIPVKQVLIESRVVLAREHFERALGIHFGSNMSSVKKSPQNNFKVSLPAHFSDPLSVGHASFAVTNFVSSRTLDLELDALEKEGLAMVVSSPRLITSNQTPAYIESGEEIPYHASTAHGATSVSFKKAVLRLEVTPHIISDRQIALDLQVNQDSKGDQIGAEFAINTREIHTKVLVNDGETVVLGGVYEQNKSNALVRVPFLGRLPGIGGLFRSHHRDSKKTELVIFVTPRIINTR